MAGGLPLPALAEAVVLFEQARQRLATVLMSSGQAWEIESAAAQLTDAAIQAQQLAEHLQQRMCVFADAIGAGGGTKDGQQGPSPTEQRKNTGTTGPAASTDETRHSRRTPARTWKTIAEEMGQVIAYASFRAATRALGRASTFTISSSKAKPCRRAAASPWRESTPRTIWRGYRPKCIEKLVPNTRGRFVGRT